MLRDIFRPSKRHPDTAPERFRRLMKSYADLHELTERKPEGLDRAALLIPRLKTAAYLIRRAEATADTCIMMAAGVPLERQDTLPSFNTVKADWAIDFIVDDQRFDANHINLQVLKSRIDCLESLMRWNGFSGNDELQLEQAKAIRDLKKIQRVVMGHGSVRRQLVKAVLVSAGAGLASGYVAGLAASQAGNPDWRMCFAGVPLSLAAVFGAVGVVRERVQQNREARELATNDFEGQLERMKGQLDSDLQLHSEEVSFAVDGCAKGLDQLLSRLLIRVDEVTRTWAHYALTSGLGPYWENESAVQ